MIKHCCLSLLAISALGAFSALGDASSVAIGGRSAAPTIETAHTPALGRTSNAAAGVFGRAASKVAALRKLNWKVALRTYAAENLAAFRRAVRLSPSGLAGEFDDTTAFSRLRLAAADTETTGLVDDPTTRVISLGSLQHQGGRVLDGTAREFRFNPGAEAILADYLRIDIAGRKDPVFALVGGFDGTLSRDESIRAAFKREKIDPTQIGPDTRIASVQEVKGVEIHGITWADLSKERTFAEQFAEINESLRHAVPQGYNGDRFDGPLLRRELELARAVDPDNAALWPEHLAPIFREDVTWIDAQDRAFSGLISRKQTGGRLKLETIARALGIKLDEFADPSQGNAVGNLVAHNALSDAEATRLVDDHFIGLIEAAKGRAMTYREVLRDQFKRRRSLRTAYERGNRYASR